MNGALIAGGSRRAVARQFQINPSSLDRHWHNCVPARLRAATDAGDDRAAGVLDGEYLLAQASELMARARATTAELHERWLAGEGSVSPRQVLAAISHEQAVIETVFRLSEAVRRQAPAHADPVAHLDILAEIDATLARLEQRKIAAEDASRARHDPEEAHARPPTGT